MKDKSEQICELIGAVAYVIGLPMMYYYFTYGLFFIAMSVSFFAISAWIHELDKKAPPHL